jgi:hypothetical protein
VPVLRRGHQGGGGRLDDATAGAACTHFENVLGDVDILTDDQLVEKLQEVERTASLSSAPELASAARAMLSAAIDDDGPRVLVAAGDFRAACQRAT